MTKLFTTGPVDVSDEVLQALASPIVPHYGPAFVQVYRQIQAQMQAILGTSGDVFIMGGAGTAGVDACVGSLVRTGDRMFIPVNGFFGYRMALTARAYGIDVVTEEFDWGHPMEIDRIARRLKDEKGLGAFGFVHSETSTGMLNPLSELTALAHEAGLPVCVDAVSSGGGVPIAMDQLGIEILVTLSSKCLAGPPGLSLIAVSTRGWAVLDQVGPPNHGFYQDLRTWREYDVRWGDFHPSPSSMPTSLVFALHAALSGIQAMGIEEHMARIARAAQRVRDGLSDLGFAMPVQGDDAGPMITAVAARPEFELADLVNYLESEHDLLVAGGVGPLRGQMIRIGHMGMATTSEYTEALLSAVAQFLEGRGLV